MRKADKADLRDSTDIRTKLAGATNEEIKAFAAALEASKAATSTDVRSSNSPSLSLSSSQQELTLYFSLPMFFSSKETSSRSSSPPETRLPSLQASSLSSVQGQPDATFFLSFSLSCSCWLLYSYAEFVVISKEIATLENDMLELKDLLGEWKGVPDALAGIGSGGVSRPIHFLLRQAKKTLWYEL